MLAGEQPHRMRTGPALRTGPVGSHKIGTRQRGTCVSDFSAGSNASKRFAFNISFVALDILRAALDALAIMAGPDSFTLFTSPISFHERFSTAEGPEEIDPSPAASAKTRASIAMCTRMARVWAR